MTSITCPRCGATSHHPADVAHGYCGRCHEYTGADLRAIVVDVDATVRRLAIPRAHDGGLTSIQTIVGGWVEAHATLNGLMFWCNEDGHTLGQGVNNWATRLWWMADARFAGHTVLLGPVVVTGGATSEGKTLDVPEAWAAELADE